MNIFQTLRSEGKSIKDICAITGKTDSHVYHSLDPEGRKKSALRQQAFRAKHIEIFKSQLGGCCKLCGYSRCSDALDFHHLDPTQKLFEISNAVYRKIKTTDKQIQEEVKKCILLCSNCHREVHAGVTSL